MWEVACAMVATATELTYLEPFHVFQCSYQCLIDSFELFSAQLYLKFFLKTDLYSIYQ